MPRDLILGTAGHIDHGKTALVKALTGIDCDRLPEEKARGITIDIGFATLLLPSPSGRGAGGEGGAPSAEAKNALQVNARLPSPPAPLPEGDGRNAPSPPAPLPEGKGSYRLGIVDVPGHERFIKNMLAGATGIDLVVLIIAADDSIMPQTREHLEILKLLGLRHGVIALTKCDLVDETTREVVELEIRELVRDTFLQDAQIVRTSAHTGMGIDELKAAIQKVCDLAICNLHSALCNLPFRLPIDRSFVVQGHGTVVTGSVHAGSLRVGAEVEWLPSGRIVRVRSLQNHDQPVDEVHRGQRAAINLAGVDHKEVVRGQEIATPGYLKPSRVLTVRIHCLSDMKRPIKHRAPVRLHVGTSEIMGTVSLLDCDTVEPSGWGLAQLFLEEPATTTWGQPFVLRGSSATLTIGGGQVLQPVAKKIRRRHLETLERIEKLWTGDPKQRTLTVAWFGGYHGFTQTDLVRDANLAPDQALAVIQQLRDEHQLVTISLQGGRQVILHADIIRELDERILTTLGRLHDETPLMTSHDRQKVQAQLDYVGDDALIHAAVERLIKTKKLVGDMRRIARADFKPKLSANLRKIKDKVVEAYHQAGFHPPEPGSFASQAGGNAANLHDLFDVCVAEGFLVRIDGDIYLHADSEAEMRKRVNERLASGPGLTVAEIRDLLGTTRKYAVPFCEYLDRVGVTKREGDLRVIGDVTTHVAPIV